MSWPLMAWAWIACLLGGCGGTDDTGAADKKTAELSQKQMCLLESLPSGAGVWLENQLLGKTPMDVRSVMNKPLKLKYPGCDPIQVTTDEEKLTVDGERVEWTRSADGARKARVELNAADEASCELICSSFPEGAEVLLDGENRGMTPIELKGLEERPYELTFKLTGYETVTRKISWREGELCKAVEVRLVSQTVEQYRKKIEAQPNNMLHYADLSHYFIVEGRISDAMEVFRKGMKRMIDGNKCSDAHRFWAEVERVISVQYTYGDSQTVDVARRMLLGMMDELFDDYGEKIGVFEFYVNYIDVAHRLKFREEAQAKLNVAQSKWKNHKRFENYYKWGYKK